ncbi:MULTISPECIES: Hsp20/alpha crystallin family protein [unclassified Deinococcus]|uniref:Hsp20/alpha crystallin family protein n=1 Tax=unclassified Deinococcus TaxID=2623546 RepID=UPI0006DBE8DF|nr:MULTISPECIES: Hsp20/alpha crystallin family protein [unclassified Deinococcus]MBX8464636.1 Hsp20/alpha crystallin family protein [Deinococcus sp. RIT780]MCD0157184.1 Hsp20/alpha crystallin family protein [Deinococcus sp. 6GRE01]MCD0160973.1 Hsp20/alpha crystallin family protein [Deinococcus sp. 6YEL10]MCD0170347.1 Hsp20/alpha crystallin family protein [Deinococcus sp. 23YEL01]MCD0176712.1 Hsp20/alpha crystallin family protein [Deinococcus sp. 14RED07]
MNEPVLARLQHLMTLREEVETLTGTGPWIPSADWADADTHLILYLDVPGVNPDTLELLEEDDTVTVAGQRDETHRLLRGERPAGTFRRTLTFPEDVLPQTGQASLAGGVLCVRFEKKHPTINVQSSDAPDDQD